MCNAAVGVDALFGVARRNDDGIDQREQLQSERDDAVALLQGAQRAAAEQRFILSTSMWRFDVSTWFDSFFFVFPRHPHTLVNDSFMFRRAGESHCMIFHTQKKNDYCFR